MRVKLTTEDCLKRFTAVHGNKYNYSRVRYQGKDKKVPIGCPDHGWFEQTPHNHWNGQTCPSCARQLRPQCRAKSLSQFIEDARKVWGDEYDYSRFVYMGNKVKGIITCRKGGHGDFRQEPSNHLSGHGCPKCGMERTIDGLCSSTEEFLCKAIVIHGERWDYSETVYARSNQKVKIGCGIHGPFFTTPNAHLRGDGCPKCGKIDCANKLKLTQEEFLDKAFAVDGDRYDYSKFVYVNYMTKGTIICREHGEFLQTPGNHIHLESGCPKCATNQLLTQEEFIKRSKEAHGERYDYTNSLYVGEKVPLPIGCHKHGVFMQTPLDHMNAHGCPRCFREYCMAVRRSPEGRFDTSMHSKMNWNK